MKPKKDPMLNWNASQAISDYTQKDVSNFLSHVEKTPACWIWVGSKNPSGYGNFAVRGKSLKAHRFSFNHFVNRLTPGLHIHHVCYNTSCVNPAHLQEVTQRVNTLDGNALSAINARKTHCKRGHPLSGENLLPTYKGQRSCRTCCRMQWRESKRRLLNIAPEVWKVGE